MKPFSAGVGGCFPFRNIRRWKISVLHQILTEFEENLWVNNIVDLVRLWPGTAMSAFCVGVLSALFSIAVERTGAKVFIFIEYVHTWVYLFVCTLSSAP